MSKIKDSGYLLDVYRAELAQARERASGAEAASAFWLIQINRIKREEYERAQREEET